MKIFARKEFPLYKPESGGWFTCEVDRLSPDDAGFNEKIDLLYKADEKKFYDAEMKEANVYFFYEETNAYLPKDKGIIELEQKIIELESKIVDIEINIAAPMTMPLELKVEKLHAVIDKVVDFMEAPVVPAPHEGAFKLRNKLNEIVGGLDSSEMIY
jgi:hypothetical protein